MGVLREVSRWWATREAAVDLVASHLQWPPRIYTPRRRILEDPRRGRLRIRPAGDAFCLVWRWVEEGEVRARGVC